MTKEDESYFTGIPQPDFPNAECTQRPDLPWVPDQTQGSLKYALDEMHRICDTCVHQSECRMFALMHPAILGVWGGTTTKERHNLRRYGYLHVSDRSA